MLTATTESAIRMLLYLSQQPQGQPVSPRELAAALGGSPTYTAKTASLLTKAGVVRSRSGAAGGILLNRAPSEITLFDIVQACQGLVTGDYCQALGAANTPEVCAFHQAMFEVHTATVQALSRWTLEILARRPLPTGSLHANNQCRMASLAGACQQCPEKEKGISSA